MASVTKEDFREELHDRGREGALRSWREADPDTRITPVDVLAVLLEEGEL